MPSSYRISRRSLIRNAAGLGTVALLAGCASSSTGDRPRRPRRIGFLAGQASKSDSGGALRQALSNLGYVEGRDFVIELRYAEGDAERLPGLAAELVNIPVDLIVTTAGGNPVRAAQQVTQTIPIVFTGLSDPVGQGLVQNLARPGGNVTGVAGLAELSGKRLELLRETVPSLARVAVLYHPSEAGQLIQVRTIQDAARLLRVAIQLEATDTLDELYAGLDAVAKRGPDGLIDCHGSSFYGPARAKFGTILDFAAKHGLPHIFGGAEDVRAGALMSLGASTEARFRVVAHLVDKILNGANPGSLPIQVADTLDLALNLTMAQKIGLTFPGSILRQATEVVQ